MFEELERKLGVECVKLAWNFETSGPTLIFYLPSPLFTIILHTHTHTHTHTQL